MVTVTQHQQLLEQVLELPPLERAEFVEIILTSFEFPSRQTIDHLWAQEAEDRIDAYERGEISAIPVQEVLAKVGKERRS